MSSPAQLSNEILLAREAVANRLRGVDTNDVAAVRRAYDAFAENDPMPELAGQAELNMGGVRCLGLMPKASSGDQIIVWLHGGGYTNGSSKSHKGLASNVAVRAGASAVIPDYRLAPEHPFPAPLEDAVAVYKAILEEGVTANNIILAGDSAGGGLALATAMKIKALGLPMAAGLILASPWVNMANDGWSYKAKERRDPFLTRDGLNAMATQYLSGASATVGDAAPINGDLRGLPPTMIQVGEAEILLSDSTLLSERLGAAGVPVSLEIWPEMFHVFQARYTMLSHARQAIDRMGAWAKSHLNRAAPSVDAQEKASA